MSLSPLISIFFVHSKRKSTKPTDLKKKSLFHPKIFSICVNEFVPRTARLPKFDNTPLRNDDDHIIHLFIC